MDEITHFCESLKRKKVTDKQLLYLYNMVILPRIEYRTQLTFLSECDCNNIIIPFRKLFKQKLHMAISMPNAILTNNCIYRFRDLVEVQKQSKITNFYIQINDQNLLGKITYIRLLQLQHSKWLQHNPLYEWPYSNVNKRHYTSFIPSMISLCKENFFTFTVSVNLRNTVLEGTDTVRSVLSTDEFDKFKHQLISHNIMFIDQLTSLDGRHLSTWSAILNRSFTDVAIKKTRIPRWFITLEQKILLTSDGSRRLMNQYINPVLYFKALPILSPPLTNRAQDWIGIWNHHTNQPLFGKIILKNRLTGIIQLEHWCISSTLSIVDNPVIVPCQGCCNNMSITQQRCFLSLPVGHAIILQKTKKIDATTRQLSLPLFDLIPMIKLHYQFTQRILPYNISAFSPISMPDNFILRYIERGEIRNELLTLQRTLASSSSLDFYTDGSAMNIGSEHTSMAFALIQTNPNSPQIQFHATIERWISASRAELVAVFLAVLLTPASANINIFTDSKAVIDHYNNLNLHQYPIFPRKIFKGAANNLIWSMLLDVIHHNHLSISFHKIRAHLGDPNNDLVDTLARNSHGYNNLSVNFTPSNLMTIPYFPLWKNIVVEPHLRHFITDVSKNIGFERFQQLHRNSKYLTLDVDWETTFFILNDEEPNTTTSFQSSFKKAHKIKFLLAELPTVEHIKLRRPDLYEGWNCPSCKNEPETFQHIWMCFNHCPIIDEIIFNRKMKLISLV